MNRRSFFISLFLNLGLFKFNLANASHKNTKSYKIISPIKFNENYYLAIFNNKGSEVSKVKLPFRAHDSIVLSDLRKLIIISRRPENKFFVFDLKKLIISDTIMAPTGRHFYGHGVYSEETKLLYLTENNYKYPDERSGSIGIYSPYKNFKRVGELPSYGIGPHELKVDNNSNLVVANGGVLTHPDYPRVKLNITNIESNIALINKKSGLLKKTIKLPKKYKELSIRHIDIDLNKNIYAGCQIYNRKSKGFLSTIFKCSKRNIEFFKFPKVFQGINNYIGTVKFLGKENFVIASFPRSGKVMVWENRNLNLVSYLNHYDACGLAINPYTEEPLISSGKGNIFSIDKENIISNKKYNFDNHFLALK